MQKITPFLWFDDETQEAVEFYTSLFEDSSAGLVMRYDKASSEAAGKPEGSVLTVAFKLRGQEFGALNGGPQFPFSPAISFFVPCKAEEIDRLFKRLSEGGEILMPLREYPFSERYAFLKDRFGVAWQLMISPSRQIAPCLLFTGENFGNAEKAVRLYASVFKNSSVGHILLYKEGEGGSAGTVKHASFHLAGQEFMAMDGEGAFTFNESISFAINCETQDEIDYYWERLSSGGSKGQCGWLKDRFGVSWQVVPSVLDELLRDQDPKKAERVMKAMLQMQKLDIGELQQAYGAGRSA